jgi:hypothetical protein
MAAVLDAPLGASASKKSIVLLDASSSWLRAGDTSAWRAAQQLVRESGSDSVIVFGDSLRVNAIPDTPTDRATRLQPALLRALGSGRAISIITDGELDDRASALDALPGGSQIMVPERGAHLDVAVVSIDAPRYITKGDSLAVRAVLVAGVGGAAPGSLQLTLGSVPVGSIDVDSLAPFGEHVVVARGYWNEDFNGPVLLSAVVSSAGDREPRNDSLFSVVDASTTPSVVFISSSPDLDARYALAVLRGTLSLPTRAFLRVAPGSWRLEGALTRVDEAEVRRAASNAPAVIIHGDTAIFGEPRSFTKGALVLVSTSTAGGDWYPVGTPASPISTALVGINWDSLPPIEVSAGVVSGDWAALETRRGRQFERRVAIGAVDSPRRIAVVGASGLWRWVLKGGVAADAHASLWGSLFDWLVAERSDERAASPALSYFRSGEVIRWRKGTAPVADADSMVIMALTPRRAQAQTDTVRLRFGASSTIAESPTLPPGVYDVQGGGGNSLLVVNQSQELVPRRAVVSAATIEGRAPEGEKRGSRRSPPVFVVLVTILCAEWLLRRRLGLR